jgi:hypothetical protein
MFTGSFTDPFLLDLKRRIAYAFTDGKELGLDWSVAMNGFGFKMFLHSLHYWLSWALAFPDCTLTCRSQYSFPMYGKL